MRSAVPESILNSLAGHTGHMVLRVPAYVGSLALILPVALFSWSIGDRQECRRNAPPSSTSPCASESGRAAPNPWSHSSSLPCGSMIICWPTMRRPAQAPSPSTWPTIGPNERDSQPIPRKAAFLEEDGKSFPHTLNVSADGQRRRRFRSIVCSSKRIGRNSWCSIGSSSAIAFLSANIS
jgi:hypothetical protein